ncbi:hypothetical protein POPTR_013G042750v4 [Populus trichocarpa]|uniref:Uncharacterized protein n=1 Tax=Populus trichocarpa TaxID=3694 RepID=A0ACC0S146_POPTR|nr:hypothetical protein BDE02_13G039200 [Populus trichocarpa]KAI9383184.1 hypothetical protein POPTR_013G042750v4 [Populus trichocarpa]
MPEEGSLLLPTPALKIVQTKSKFLGTSSTTLTMNCEFQTRDLAFQYRIEICVFGVHGQTISKGDNCTVACVISESHASSGCRF